MRVSYHETPAVTLAVVVIVVMPVDVNVWQNLDGHTTLS